MSLQAEVNQTIGLICGATALAAVHFGVKQFYVKPLVEMYNNRDDRVTIRNNTHLPLRVTSVEYARYTDPGWIPESQAIEEQRWIWPGEKTVTHTEDAKRRKKLADRHYRIGVRVRVAFLPLWFKVWRECE